MQVFTLETASTKSRPAAQGADLLAVVTRLKPALLADLDADHLAALLTEVSLVHIRRPKDILHQGQAADWIYLIIKGRIEVNYLDINGNRVMAHLATPGEVLGEVEQFSGRTCAASCTTLPDTTLMLMDAAMVLRHVPADLLMRNFAKIFHDRLTRDNRQHSVAMFYAAEDRIRINLLTMTSAETPQIHLNQADLAAIAGCSRQTVNKTLSQLRAEGIVAMGRGEIRVLDRARLKTARPGGDRMLPDEGLGGFARAPDAARPLAVMPKA
ncbi:Crp/Fnr family transcriptional regulator [Paracoccus sp. Ld10]|uniref:Crp/Fnr family transcriptional regulator n=1 Tax=Paracoccus sp. Ld10 TaxID=649158 RepID=UPI00386F7623